MAQGCAARCACFPALINCVRDVIFKKVNNFRCQSTISPFKEQLAPALSLSINFTVCPWVNRIHIPAGNANISYNIRIP